MTHATIEAARIEKTPWVLRYFWPLLAGLLVLRLFIDARITLAPDEAVYWCWSRHLALSYFDHPPMIAWLNWLTTHLLGSTELGVRLYATLMGLGIIALVVAMARIILPDARAVAWVAIIWLVSPLAAGWSIIATPDTPSIFFSAAALLCVLKIARRDDVRESNKVKVGGADRELPSPQPSPGLPGEGVDTAASMSSGSIAESPAIGLWLLFGLFSGLALLSKYTAILPCFATAVSFLFSSSGRRHLARPWAWLSAVVALLVFSPVLWWNHQHQWASFAFQLHHGISQAPAAPIWWRLVLVGRNLLLYLGGQAVMWTPILFIIGLVILWEQARRLLARPARSEVDRLLLFNAALPLLLFGWASSRKLGELNWPTWAYVPLSLMVGRWLLDPRFAAERTHAVREACKVAAGFTIVIHLVLIPGLPQLCRALHMTIPRVARELLQSDRHDFGVALARAAHGAPIVFNRHQDAAEAAFYTPGQPDVWCDGIGSRPTAWDYFEPWPDFNAIPVVLFVGGGDSRGNVRLFMKKYHFTTLQLVDISTPAVETDNMRTGFLLSR